MKIKTFTIIAFATLFVSINSLAQNNRIGEKQIDEINKMVENLANTDRFSGAVLITKDNQIIYQKVLGLADKTNNKKINIETKFNLASMNKMFTSVAITQLVEKNKLNFTDKLIKHLPNLSEKIFGEITIEQLLTHTSGTGDYFMNPNFMNIKDTAKTLSTYLKLGMNTPLLFKPGTKFEYSNYGYILLGIVIEKLSNMSYFDYVKTNIFSVADMKNTDSYATDNPTDHMAIGYAMPPPIPGENAMGEKKEREINTKIIEVKGTSAGGGYSTAIDLNKFSLALLSGKLISKKGVETITKGKVAMPMRPMPPGANPIPEIKYGFGFGEFYKNGNRIIGHNGGAPGVDVQMDIFPNLGYTVVILSNYDRSAMPLINFIEDTICNNHK